MEPLQLGGRLAGARRTAKLTREQAAVLSGKSWSSITSYERGIVVPPLPVLAVLAAMYGTSLSDLLQDEAVSA